MLAGNPGRATPLIEAQLADGWDTAEAYWILAQARRKLGRRQAAEHAKTEALRRNPQSEKMYAFMP
jgi:predicted Zn-dependent protease